MKSADPWTRIGQEIRRNPEGIGMLPAPATLVPTTCPTAHDSTDTALKENDPTRAFLHQLSQTLTCLRGTLELALLVDCDAQDYRRAIQQSLVQAEALVQLFKSYRASAHGGKDRPGA